MNKKAAMIYLVTRKSEEIPALPGTLFWTGNFTAGQKNDNDYFTSTTGATFPSGATRLNIYLAVDLTNAEIPDTYSLKYPIDSTINSGAAALDPSPYGFFWTVIPANTGYSEINPAVTITEDTIIMYVTKIAPVIKAISFEAAS